jgi:hypothetical protein
MLDTVSSIKAKAKQLAKLWADEDSVARSQVIQELDEMPPFLALAVAVETYGILHAQYDDDPAAVLTDLVCVLARLYHQYQ